MTQDSESPAPLEGIRVLELGNYIAAPFATRILADFGAEVIKVERPGTGDELRRWRGTPGDTSMLFRTLGRNKRCITLDLSGEEGRDIALQLAGSCDIVVENFRPGTLERWGLGPERLTEANPDLVLVRISGYGQTGPYRERPGFGGVAEAFAGLRHITGSPDRPPVRSAAAVADTAAGLYAVIGALMLLLRRARGHEPDRPQVVDIALYEAVFSMLEAMVPEYDAYGIVRERTEGALPGVVPSGIYPCRDGQSVVINGNGNGIFVRLMRTAGRPDLADDPALADAPGRAARADELDAALTAWTGRHTMADVLDALAGAGVPSGPVHNAATIVNDPQYRARGMLQEFEVDIADETRKVRFPGVVPVLPGSPGSVKWLGPEVGSHTEQVLTGTLGLSETRVEELRDRKVI
ncbi:CaiB/BaiF CoA transferase family protein [Streptomyces purpurogeneiscleroticus]|uniref:CaiB/BaiF CoA transferase family protein n=1 Tax=Streptomyces purpurogeneiscleroticus TaxID=68259 RepID=UPI001CBBBA5D|nr:CaiB/BaiF CoA-transferase family protein [Streptomyces purpurogeneiscleroticus]MBZ4020374.1 formyl-CoA transferase [Streptomyces purpurogeneiscleroticus]